MICIPISIGNHCISEPVQCWLNKSLQLLRILVIDCFLLIVQLGIRENLNHILLEFFHARILLIFCLIFICFLPF